MLAGLEVSVERCAVASAAERNPSEQWADEARGYMAMAAQRLGIGALEIDSRKGSNDNASKRAANTLISWRIDAQ